ncbi:hypothetical protein BLNAU_8766 [Blattamonas nauphoetae]|uniref:Uncharacterized protein n=1 Tax=Blattamonas nauphoetae TaxID=2049346 RepID=A0ABQ9XXH2_9EUKA|nr:hypothetical protein BLNAU_8766 [Blattamonas nauphoetae]
MTAEPFISTQITVGNLSTLVTDLERQIKEKKTNDAIVTLKNMCYLQRGPHSPFPTICLEVFSSDSHRKIISYTHYVLDMFADEASLDIRKKVITLMQNILTQNDQLPIRTTLALRTLAAYCSKDTPTEFDRLLATVNTFMSPSKNSLFDRQAKWYQNKQAVEVSIQADRAVAQIGALNVLYDKAWVKGAFTIEKKTPFSFFVNSLVETLSCPFPVPASAVLLVFANAFNKQTASSITFITKGICMRYTQTKQDAGKSFFTVKGSDVPKPAPEPSLSDPLFRVRLVQLCVKIIRHFKELSTELANQKTDSEKLQKDLAVANQTTDEFTIFLFAIASDDVVVHGATIPAEEEDDKAEGTLGGTPLHSLPHNIQLAHRALSRLHQPDGQFDYTVFSPYFLALRAICSIPWTDRGFYAMPTTVQSFVVFFQNAFRAPIPEGSDRKDFPLPQPFLFALLRTALVVVNCVAQRLGIATSTRLFHPLMNIVLDLLAHPSAHIRLLAGQLLVWVVDNRIPIKTKEGTTDDLHFYIDPAHLFRFVHDELASNTPIFWARFLVSMLDRLKVSPSFVTTAWATVRQLFLAPLLKREQCHVILDAECSELVWAVYLQGCLFEGRRDKPLLLDFLFDQLNHTTNDEIRRAILVFVGEFCWFLTDGLSTRRRKGFSPTFYIDTIINYLFEGATLSDWQTRLVCSQTLCSTAMLAPNEMRGELAQMIQQVVELDETLHPQLSVPLSILHSVVSKANTFIENVLDEESTPDTVSGSALVAIHNTHLNLLKAVRVHCIPQSAPNKNDLEHLGQSILGRIRFSQTGAQFPLGIESKPFLDKYEAIKNISK